MIEVCTAPESIVRCVDHPHRAVHSHVSLPPLPQAVFQQHLKFLPDAIGERDAGSEFRFSRSIPNSTAIGAAASILSPVCSTLSGHAVISRADWSNVGLRQHLIMVPTSSVKWDHSAHSKTPLDEKSKSTRTLFPALVLVLSTRSRRLSYRTGFSLPLTLWTPNHKTHQYSVPMI